MKTLTGLLIGEAGEPIHETGVSSLNGGGCNLLHMSCMYDVHVGQQPTWVDKNAERSFPSHLSTVEGSTLNYLMIGLSLGKPYVSRDDSLRPLDL